MKFTPDDKLRLMGILLTVEDMKDYIGDVTNATKGGGKGNRRHLDASTSRRTAAFSIAHDMYIDMEVVIKLPEKWFDPLCKETIDHYQESFFLKRTEL